MLLFKYSTLLALLLLFTNDLTGQISANGFIRDSLNKEPIIGANIYTADLNYGCISDENGYFQIMVPEEYDTLIISYIGYQNKNISTINPSSSTYYLSTLSLNTVEIKAKKSYPLEPIGSVSLSNQEIKRIPALLGEEDVIKAFAMLPGVSSASEGSVGFIVRGGALGQNGIYLNDAPVYNSNHFFGYLSPFNTSTIKSAQLTKSGFKANDGGYLSSILDIYSRDGDPKHHNGEIKIGLVNSSIFLNGPLLKDKLTYALSFRVANFSPLTALSKYLYKKKILEGYLKYYMFDTNVKLAYQLSKNSTLKYSSYFSKDDLTIYLEDALDISSPKLTWGNSVHNLSLHSILNKKITLKADAYTSKYRYSDRQRVTSKKDSIHLSYSNDTHIWDRSVGCSIDYMHSYANATQIGGRYTYRTIVPRNVNLKISFGDSTNVKENYESYAAHEASGFINHRYFINQKLKLNVGVRYDRFTTKEYSKNVLSPRISLSYLSNPDSELKLSYDKMIQPFHLLLTQDAGFLREQWVGASQILPLAHSEQFSLDYSKNNVNVFSNIKASIFYKKIHNATRLINTEVLYFDPNYNWKSNITNGESKSIGIELLLKKDLGRFAGWAGYTYTQSISKYDGINGNNYFKTDYIPDHEFELSASYNISKKWTVASNFVMHSGHPYTLPSAVVQNPIGGYSAYISGINNKNGEIYHRLDLSFSRSTTTKKGNSKVLGFGVYNAYFKLNPYKYAILDGNRDDGYTIKIRKYSYFNFLPYINYSYKF